MASQEVKGNKPNPENLKFNGVRLPMYKPGALERGELDGLIKEFYGRRALWLGAYVGNSERVIAHELRRKQRYLANHPEMDADTYDKERHEHLEMQKRISKGEINARFRMAVGRRFNTPIPDKFADKQFELASNAMASVTQTLFPDSGVAVQLNETYLLPIDAAATVERIASPDTSEVLLHEELLHHLNAHISGELDERADNTDAGRKLSQIQDLLNRTLFAGKHGDTETADISAIYDDVTNDVEFIDGVNGRLYKKNLPEGKHIKTTELAMRTIRDSNIRIHTSPDRKTRESEIIKAVRIAQENMVTTGDDQVKPLDAVQDTHRMLFAVDGGPAKVQEVFEKVKGILVDPDNQQYLARLDMFGEPIRGNDGQFEGRVVEIKDKNQKSGHTGQSKHSSYKRILVFFDGLSVPIEIKFQSLREFLKDEFHVGRYNEKKRFYNGAAHKLYEFRRALKIAPQFIPVAALRREVDLASIAAETQEKIVADLRRTTKKAK